MDPAVSALIVASALLHALWNAALKRQPDPEAASVAILGVAALAAAAALPLLGGGAAPGGAGLGWALAAGLCEGGYFMALALAFRAAPFGLVYTVARGGALALIWPVSVLWLGEPLTVRAAAGALLLVAGLALVGLERRGRATLAGVLWAVACAGAIAGYHLSYKRALTTGAAPGAVFATALCVAWPLAVLRLGPGGLGRPLRALRSRPGTLVAAGLLCTASFLLFLTALVRGGAGAAVTLRNTSVLFGLALAWALGERPGRPQVVGTLGVALGAAVIGWPR